MRKEKQIEEMAKISCNTNNSEIKWNCAECPFDTMCDIQISCEALYNAGYRKQSEGEWKYDEDCECFVCSVCEHSALNNYRLLSTPSNYCPNCGAKMKGGAE